VPLSKIFKEVISVVVSVISNRTGVLPGQRWWLQVVPWSG
jgi:hypothetical protein